MKQTDGRDMKGMIDIKLIPHDSWNKSNINPGPLKLPDNISGDGELIAVGENDEYLHCFINCQCWDSGFIK